MAGFCIYLELGGSVEEKDWRASHLVDAFLLLNLCAVLALLRLCKSLSSLSNGEKFLMRGVEMAHWLRIMLF